MNASFQDQVRERAYQLWLQEGQVHGRAEQHWLQAEHDLQSLAQPATVTSKSKGRSTSKSPAPRSRQKAAVEAQVAH